MKIGITGGIGSGKSYVCKLLAAQGIEVYDCDRAAKRLMRESPQLRHLLTALIGEQAYLPVPTAKNDEHGTGWILNKAAIAQFLLASEQHAKALDAIVHPAVFSDFKSSGMTWLESAILFESGLDKMVDQVVMVSAPDETRLTRIMQRDHISREKAEQWMARQWPQEEVRSRSHFEIVNDGIKPLQPQVTALIQALNDTHTPYII